MEIPRRDAAAIEGAPHFDQSRGPAVRTDEFFFPRPGDAHRLSGGLGEFRGLEGDFGTVLAAESTSSGSYDDPDLLRADAERIGKLAAHAERHLSATVYGQFLVVPECHGCPRLHGHVRDVCHRVRRLMPSF